MQVFTSLILERKTVYGIKMFIILLDYKVSLEIVDKYLSEHREYLKSFYTNNNLLMSGAKSPRVGGVIVANFDCKDKVYSMIENDPFYKNNIADFEVIEFSPAMIHKDYQDFVKP